MESWQKCGLVVVVPRSWEEEEERERSDEDHAVGGTDVARGDPVRRPAALRDQNLRRREQCDEGEEAVGREDDVVKD